MPDLGLRGTFRFFYALIEGLRCTRDWFGVAK